MTTISHRDLRNSSGAILRAAAAGESFTVTNNGDPVARIVPVEAAEPELPCVRPATVRGGFVDLHRHTIDLVSLEVLDDLRGDR